MKKYKIERIDINGNRMKFFNLEEAAKSISSKLENWKIQLFIADAINHNKKAFKYNWIRIEK